MLSVSQVPVHSTSLDCSPRQAAEIYFLEMNPVLLTDWLTVCAQGGIDAIPAKVGPAVHIDDLYSFIENFRMLPSLSRAHRWLCDNYNKKTSIWRWDCCSPVSLKEAIREGSVQLPLSLFFEPDDSRLASAITIAEQYGAHEIKILIRPWVNATIEARFPVEFRAFAWPGCVAVTNYHRNRPLPERFQGVAKRILQLTETLALHAGQPSFSADYILDRTGNILFLEGGLGFDGGRLVDSCCFDRAPKPMEIALSVIQTL